MTSETIKQIERALHEKQRVANLIKRCNDLFPAKHKFTFPRFTAEEAEKLNKENDKQFFQFESKTLIKRKK